MPDVPSSLHSVDEFGQASEQFFSRLYNNLLRRGRGTDRSLADTAALRRDLVRTEREITQISAALAAITDGVIMQDNDGRLVIVNARARELIGSIKAFWDSPLGTLFNEYRAFTPDFSLTSEVQVIPVGQPTRVQMNNRIIGANLAAVYDGRDRIGTLFILRDVTGDAVSERMKDQFITAISHELRTPLTVIKGVSELIGEQAKTGSPAPRLLETLSRNVDILDRMIIELLDIAELNTDDFSIRQDRIDAEAMLWATVEGLKPESLRARHTATVMARDTGTEPGGLSLIGDEQKLRWAFGHLLQNAIRYTEPGGLIVVIINRAANNTLALQVTDTGVGISDKDLPHIFNRFYRGEPRTPAGRLIDPRGLGQGLYIARSVFEAHGGYVRVNSQPGHGSTFVVTLPAAP